MKLCIETGLSTLKANSLLLPFVLSLLFNSTALLLVASPRTRIIKQDGEEEEEAALHDGADHALQLRAALRLGPAQGFLPQPPRLLQAQQRRRQGHRRPGSAGPAEMIDPAGRVSSQFFLAARSFSQVLA